MGGKWRAHLVNVTLGLQNPQYAQIRTGLNEGDQVIYEGYESLKEGDPVVPAQWGPNGPLSLPPAAGVVSARSAGAPGKVKYRAHCGMIYTADEAKKYHYICPMDHLPLVKITVGGR